MRKREAEAIVDDIINELRSMPGFRGVIDQLDDLKQKLVKIVMDEE